ncbi:hypothetical protein CGL56_16690 [Neolewinella marina]|uniref:Amidohydrolase-related domain-containing protein n=2 Tax=Neolewinella marina TaxID=438751 RepID=A0A2G0CB63_9BACT|nr:hypothetical protein CGL56_16690 [Neolewinella marina]
MVGHGALRFLQNYPGGAGRLLISITADDRMHHHSHPTLPAGMPGPSRPRLPGYRRTPKLNGISEHPICHIRIRRLTGSASNPAMRFTLCFFLMLQACWLPAQIIDVHLHGYTDQDYWGGRPHPSGAESPPTAGEHMRQTIALMDQHDIEYAVVSGSPEATAQYVAADPRFIPGYMDDGSLIPVSEFEQLIKEGRIKVFGEVSGVYRGATLNDSIYQPYLALCEEYGIPVAYHTGGGPPMTPYRCCPEFRISLGDPFLIEDVLVRYPRLQLSLMHGGEVFFEHAVRMMTMYLHLYVDLGVLLWAAPPVQDYAVRLLKLAKQHGVLDRVMFGSDQMVWPGGITKSVEFLNSLDFLTEEEKRMILYDNAKRFLKLE